MQLYSNGESTYKVQEMTNLEYLMFTGDTQSPYLIGLEIKNGMYVEYVDEKFTTKSWYPENLFKEYFKDFHVI